MFFCGFYCDSCTYVSLIFKRCRKKRTILVLLRYTDTQSSQKQSFMYKHCNKPFLPQQSAILFVTKWRIWTRYCLFFHERRSDLWWTIDESKNDMHFLLQSLKSNYKFNSLLDLSNLDNWDQISNDPY